MRKPISIAILGIVAVFAVSSLAWSGQPTIVPPDSVGMSSEKLANIDSAVRRAISNKETRGAVVLVARHGKVCYLKAFGEADEGKAMKTDAIFRLASMSKLFSAVAAMQLVEDGKLLLNDPVSKYIPGFKDIKVGELVASGEIKLVAPKREINIHDLLAMTSGMAASWSWQGKVHEYIVKKMKELKICDTMMPLETNLEQYVKQILQLPLGTHPGEAYEYSNMGVLTLARVVEIVSGVPLDRYYEEHIYKPLGMSEIWFFPPKHVWPRMPAVFHSGTLEKIPGVIGADDTQLPFSDTKTFFNTAGGLMATASDYFKFIQMMLNKGELNGVRLLSSKTVELMTSNKIGGLADDFFQNKWGYMVDIQADSNPPGFYWGGEGAYGWHGYWGTMFSVQPSDDTLVLVFTSTYLWPNLWDLEQKIIHIAGSATLN